jgi:hypothetical protein
MNRLIVLFIVLAITVPFGAANALRLDVWNVDELEASDDYVDLQFGSYQGNTTLSIQWMGGADDSSGALGIDKFFINNASSSLAVVNVFRGSILAGNDVSSAWLPTGGGTNAGGGFGGFTEKVAEPAGRGGIGEALIFVLNGSYTASSFAANARGATFAAHLRYGNGCSGWVADGGRSGGSGSDAACGGVAAVPEPSAALVFAVGAVLVGGSMRRARHARAA